MTQHVSVLVCVHVSERVRVCACLCAHACACVCACLCAHACACVCAFVCVCVCVCVHACLCTCLRTCVCMCVCVPACMSVSALSRGNMLTNLQLVLISFTPTAYRGMVLVSSDHEKAGVGHTAWVIRHLPNFVGCENAFLLHKEHEPALSPRAVRVVLFHQKQGREFRWGVEGLQA